MYVAVKGGRKAIDNAHRLMAAERRGDEALPELGLDQIKEQLSLAVDRVMTEGSVFDPDLAALALKQARGDVTEAVFLVRAFRTTLPRLAYSLPIDTSKMDLKRRISAAFKDLPGGQLLGPTFDYTHRLLDFNLAAENGPRSEPPAETEPEMLRPPKTTGLLGQEGLIEQDRPEDGAPVGDITREPLTLPTGRDVRLQSLARGDEGFVFALGYSVQRGFGATGHPFVGEIRYGRTAVEIVPEELGFAVDIGDITVTECDMIHFYKGGKDRPPQFTKGYGLTFGYCERKAMAMSLVDRALRVDEFDEAVDSPAQDEEFVLAHCDNVESSGFVQHLKLPHHVDFQAELVMLRRMRAGREESASEGEDSRGEK